jgi:hypothetical protein
MNPEDVPNRSLVDGYFATDAAMYQHMAWRLEHTRARERELLEVMFGHLALALAPLERGLYNEHVEPPSVREAKEKLGARLGRWKRDVGWELRSLVNRLWSAIDNHDSGRIEWDAPVIILGGVSITKGKKISRLAPRTDGSGIMYDTVPRHYREKTERMWGEFHRAAHRAVHNPRDDGAALVLLITATQLGAWLDWLE